MEIINVITPDPIIFLWITSSVADAAAVNPNGIKTFLANGLSTFPIKTNLVFSNSHKSLPKNPPGCPILCNWVFDKLILAEELFAKASWSFETYVLVNKNLCGKLCLSLESPTTFNEIFTLLSFRQVELGNFTFKVLYWVILFWYYIKTK